jgi:protein gp37
MSTITDIQWADTTVNPIMGCGGCELYPSPGQVLGAIDAAVAATGPRVDSRTIYKELIHEAYSKILQPKPGHHNAVNTTNLWHFRALFLDRVKHDHGEEARVAAEMAIRQSITCYAATLHLNKGQNLLNQDYAGHKGYAPIFEAVTRFEGRSADAAKLPDLLGCANPLTPWKARLARLIFVSDMGDAFSTKDDFAFLRSDLMPAITSVAGKRHLWLWLTKRPELMGRFADEIGGFPENVCAMTTLTGPDPDSLARLAHLKTVKASIRGLSIEPLWDRIPPSELNLKGIDWVIVGGESGSGFEFTRPFALEWAEELHDHCRKNGVAFFLKQLSRNPTRGGDTIRLRNENGGNWDEWPDESLKVREFPDAFHQYRRDEMKPASKPRPVFTGKKKKKAAEDLAVNAEDHAEFRRLDKIVRKGIEAFADAGGALLRIHDGKLWRAGGHHTWEDYCRSVAGMSKVHASRLMRASQCFIEMKTLPTGNVLPVSESQIRPLLKLEDSEKRAAAWVGAVEKAEGNQPTAADVQEVVFEILNPDGAAEKPPSRSQRRTELAGRLRAVIAERKSWDDLESLMSELEELL